MVGNLAKLLKDFHREELRDLRSNARMAVVIPLFLLYASLIAGVASGELLKQVFLAAMLTITSFYFALIAVKRALLGIEMTYVFTTTPSSLPTSASDSNPLLEIMREYLRIAGAIVASETAAGLLLYFVPIQNNPLGTFLLVPLTIGTMSYALWRGAGAWWPFVVGFILIVGFAYVLITSFFPEFSGSLPNKLKEIDLSAAVHSFSIEKSAGVKPLCTGNETFVVVNPTDPHIVQDALDRGCMSVKVSHDPRFGGPLVTAIHRPMCVFEYWVSDVNNDAVLIGDGIPYKVKDYMPPKHLPPMPGVREIKIQSTTRLDIKFWCYENRGKVIAPIPTSSAPEKPTSSRWTAYD